MVFKTRMCIAVKRDGMFEGFLKGDDRKDIKSKAKELGVRLDGVYFNCV